LKENIEPNTQERILRAFLDIIILRMLLNHPMTAYQIDNSVLKRHGSKISPNVVFTKLANLERKELISCAQSRHGRVYSITERGRKMVNINSNVIEEIQKSAPIVLA